MLHLNRLKVLLQLQQVQNLLIRGMNRRILALQVGAVAAGAGLCVDRLAAGDGSGGVGGLAPPGYEEDNSASLLLDSSRGKLRPWTGQALPTQVFVPVGPRPPGGLWPVLVYFHGGNDGPWDTMAQQAFLGASGR